MQEIETLIYMARDLQASDIHATVGAPLMFRIHGSLTQAPIQPSDQDMEDMLYGLLNEHQQGQLQQGYDIDFAIQTPDGNRQRVNVFRQQNAIAATIRLLNNHIPTLEELKMPKKLYQLAEEPRGLILVTGPTGSGKSTTLAAMLEHINQTKAVHIITIEDPIEYTYENKKALIHQRETGRDVVNFASALRSALREDPDIILVGEMRDYETISAALTAAETGHLVLSTLHTTGAAQTIDRVIDACPAGGQNQVRTQLSGVLKGVVTQCLMPTADGNGRVAGTELLLGTDAVCNLIRESKTHQMASVMQSGAAMGMHTLNMDLMRLVGQGLITKETAVQYTNDRRDLQQYC
ncbi:MAG: type IV pilus twitching motility protein PilT [Oscillospiraceae bacterium]|nr:type IV pilus twitching motility protein PilT [Oscillospiraceae bacterium]